MSQQPDANRYTPFFASCYKHSPHIMALARFGEVSSSWHSEQNRSHRSYILYMFKKKWFLYNESIHCFVSNKAPTPLLLLLSLTNVPPDHSWTITRVPLLSHSPFNSQWEVSGQSWREHKSRTIQPQNIWLQFEPKGRYKGNKQLRGNEQRIQLPMQD